MGFEGLGVALRDALDLEVERDMEKGFEEFDDGDSIEIPIGGSADGMVEGWLNECLGWNNDNNSVIAGVTLILVGSYVSMEWR